MTNAIEKFCSLNVLANIEKGCKLSTKDGLYEQLFDSKGRHIMMRAIVLEENKEVVKTFIATRDENGVLQ